MFLIDTNVISECRKGARANSGVKSFFDNRLQQGDDLYISVITLGELRRGIELVRHRGDNKQAILLEQWLECIIDNYSDAILDFGVNEAQVWGALRVPHHQHLLDKQIAAIALTHDLMVVTRNTTDFKSTGVKLLNPFV